MKALLYERYGGPEVLHISEQPVPRPEPSDAIVRVHAATVGIGDCKSRAGLLTDFHGTLLPKIPGRYGTGTVAALGKQAGHITIGDAVVFSTLHSERGSAAEYVRVRADKTAPKPRNLSHVETASMIQGGTCAYVCLIETGKVVAGQRILVHGGAGSVGSACVELGRHLGAVVTATCRGADRDYVRGLGAEHVVAFDSEDFATEVRGQDLVVDLHGGEVHRRSYRPLKRGGKIVYLNAEPFDNEGKLYGIEIVNAVIDNRGSVLDAVCRLAEQGIFTPKIGKVLPLAEGARAHGLVEAGAIKRGRVILQVA